MWWYHGDWSWGAWLVMTVGMVAFWGLVIWAVIAVARSGDAGAARRDRTPEEVLAGRLAHRDIDEDEYRRRLDTLREPAASGATEPAGKS